MRHRIHTAPFAIFLSLIAGCGGIAFRPVEGGNLSDEIERIEAVDGTFVLEAGVAFRTPFSSGGRSAEVCGWGSTDVPDAALEIGRRVMVHHPAADHPIHGLLILCDVPEAARGPASRSYLIRVPGRYISETSGGRITVVYEPAYGGYNAWILWLAETPFR